MLDFNTTDHINKAIADEMLSRIKGPFEIILKSDPQDANYPFWHLLVDGKEIARGYEPVRLLRDHALTLVMKSRGLE